MDYSFIAIDEDRINWKETMRVGDGAQPKKNLNFLWREIHTQPFLGRSSYFLSYKQRPYFYVSRN